MGQNQNRVFKFKKDNPDLNKRKELCNNLLKNNPKKIPIIIEPDLIRFKEFIIKTKYLVSEYITLFQFYSLIRKQLDIDPQESLFLVINGTTVITDDLFINEIYKKFKDIDGFLYIKYTGTEIWGND